MLKALNHCLDELARRGPLKSASGVVLPDLQEITGQIWLEHRQDKEQERLRGLSASFGGFPDHRLDVFRAGFGDLVLLPRLLAGARFAQLYGQCGPRRLQFFKRTCDVGNAMPEVF